MRYTKIIGKYRLKTSPREFNNDITYENSKDLDQIVESLKKSWLIDTSGLFNARYFSKSEIEYLKSKVDKNNLYIVEEPLELCDLLYHSESNSMCMVYRFHINIHGSDDDYTIVRMYTGIDTKSILYGFSDSLTCIKSDELVYKSMNEINELGFTDDVFKIGHRMMMEMFYH